ncbi:TetR/AcrR family transcriptional regulator [Mycobacterium sp. NAZ190054]|uniref:TetR/AcrR family transcriptional regulator n=1 Tax=Mycobacterium sp. NAZ190054 TaxID=1747766 RepID=UPI00079279DE|nr:TetR/AcrR family transcriptional regulator [Mycobacterium sp. NAZ190054]KWX65847.1 TetR family transcriptional regulator [Mycobacterium sp. NAZ190054]
MSAADDVGARERIVRAAAELLDAKGREAVTTRAVCAAAKVQSPTIYRHFGDMRGLLDAAASHGFAAYLANKKTRPPAEDSVDDLRRGWDLSVEFGLAHPAVYTVLYGDPRPHARPAAVAQADEVLRGIVARIAEAGRLRIGVERAAQMMHSACRGVVLTLISMPPEDRDAGLSAATREAFISVITTDAATGADNADGAGPRAIALKASLRDTAVLTEAEAGLLNEWLDRLAATP